MIKVTPFLTITTAYQKAPLGHPTEMASWRFSDCPGVREGPDPWVFNEHGDFTLQRGDLTIKNERLKGLNHQKVAFNGALTMKNMDPTLKFGIVRGFKQQNMEMMVVVKPLGMSDNPFMVIQYLG